jgi:hypothetical protein
MEAVAFRFQDHARRRAVLAGLLGVGMIALFGPVLAVPAVAFVALVYYVHQVIAVLVGDERVAYPTLALVIVVNAAVVLAVQALLTFDALRTS